MQKYKRERKERENRDNNIEQVRKYHNEYDKKWRKENKDKLLIKERERYENNKEKINARKRISSKIHYKNNAEKYKQYRKNSNTRRKERHKERLNTDPIYKLKCTLKGIIRKSIQRKGFIKKSKTAIILGCPISEFKNYLEQKFQPWMNWNNYGLYNGELNYGWDLDHIVPLVSAKTEQEVIDLNHYTNFQPLCSYANRVTKRDTYKTETTYPLTVFL